MATMQRSLVDRKGYRREHRTPPAPEVVTLIAGSPEAEALARDNAAIAAAKKAAEEKHRQERTRLGKQLDAANLASMARVAARTSVPMSEELYRARMKEMDEREKEERRSNALARKSAPTKVEE